jgi:hypothetical protein
MQNQVHPCPFLKVQPNKLHKHATDLLTGIPSVPSTPTNSDHGTSTISLALESSGLITPSNAALASPENLAAMSIEQKRALCCSMSLDELYHMTVEQLTALNPQNDPPNLLGPFHESEMGERLRIVQSELGNVAIMATPKDLRWYAVLFGVNFTGICRGTTELAAVCPQHVSGVYRVRAKTQVMARSIWLRAYYSRRTGRI